MLNRDHAASNNARVYRLHSRRPEPVSAGTGDGGAALERAAEGQLIGVLEVAADRQTAGQLAHAQAERGEHPDEVGGRRLALEVRIGGDDDLGDGAVLQARQQLLDAQLVGADAGDGTDRTTQHVIAAAEFAGALDGDDVLALLDDTDDAGVAPRVGADLAFDVDRDIAADNAEVDLLLGLGDGGRQPSDVGRVGVEDVERDALGALRTDAGQTPEFVDEVLNQPVIHGAFSVMRGAA